MAKGRQEVIKPDANNQIVSINGRNVGTIKKIGEEILAEIEGGVEDIQGIEIVKPNIQLIATHFEITPFKDFDIDENALTGPKKLPRLKSGNQQ